MNSCNTITKLNVNRNKKEYKTTKNKMKGKANGREKKKKQVLCKLKRNLKQTYILGINVRLQNRN